MENFFLIRWSHDYNDNYNYGANIKFLKDGKISFSSPLMPSGSVIKTWRSVTSFQSDRKTPMLPLLAQENTYKIAVVGLLDEVEDIQLAIEFYDNDEQLIKRKYFTSLNGVFTYPEKAVSYQVLLLNKNHQTFVFDYLLIADLSVENHYEINLKEDLKAVSFINNEIVSENDIILLNGAKETICMPLNESPPKNYFFIFIDKESDWLENVAYIYQVIANNGIHGDSFFTIQRGIDHKKIIKEGLIASKLLYSILSNVSKKDWYLKQKSINEEISEQIRVNDFASKILLQYSVGGKKE
ncbi:accessory Sec system protein Asp3 [Enterococcus sp. AZ103]|uniref:accessory Sec system protein Asp3 n=1 Tax=Enterococcus sp. AZ103 TaxID=2774628 RepID=UPI003F255B63